MNALVYLIPVALGLGVVALVTFLWTLKTGQYEDLEGAGARVLLDEGEEEEGEASRGRNV